MDLIVQYGGIEGDHHRAWVLDQVFRLLAAEKYESLVAEACRGECGLAVYTWDEGVAP